MLGNFQDRDKCETEFHDFALNNPVLCFEYLKLMLSDELHQKESLTLIYSLISHKNTAIYKEKISELNIIFSQISSIIINTPNIINNYDDLPLHIFSKIFVYYLVESLENPVQYLLSFLSNDNKRSIKTVLITLSWAIKLDKIEINNIYLIACQIISEYIVQPYDYAYEGTLYLLQVIWGKTHNEELIQFSKTIISQINTIPVNRLKSFISYINDIYQEGSEIFSEFIPNLIFFLTQVLCNQTLEYSIRSTACIFISSIICTDYESIKDFEQDLINVSINTILSEPDPDESEIIQDCIMLISDLMLYARDEELNSSIYSEVEKNLQKSESICHFLGISLLTELNKNSAKCISDNVEVILDIISSALSTDNKFIQKSALDFLQIENKEINSYSEVFVNLLIQFSSTVQDEEILINTLDAVQVQISQTDNPSVSIIAELTILIQNAIQYQILVHPALILIDEIVKKLEEGFLDVFNEFESIIIGSLQNSEFFNDGTQIVLDIYKYCEELPLIDTFVDAFNSINFDDFTRTEILEIINAAVVMDVLTNYIDDGSPYYSFILEVAGTKLLPLAENEVAKNVIILKSDGLAFEYDEDLKKDILFALEIFNKIIKKDKSIYDTDSIITVALNAMKAFFDDLNSLGAKILKTLVKCGETDLVINFFREAVYETCASRLCKEELFDVLEKISKNQKNPEFLDLFVTICENFINFNEDELMKNKSFSIISENLYNILLQFRDLVSNDIIERVKSIFPFDDRIDTVRIWSILSIFDSDKIDALLPLFEVYSQSDNENDRETIAMSMLTIVSHCKTFDFKFVLRIAASMIDSYEKLCENTETCNVSAYQCCVLLSNKIQKNDENLLIITRSVEEYFK